jgi:hypothetical protein
MWDAVLDDIDAALAGADDRARESAARERARAVWAGVTLADRIRAAPGAVALEIGHGVLLEGRPALVAADHVELHACRVSAAPAAPGDAAHEVHQACAAVRLGLSRGSGWAQPSGLDDEAPPSARRAVVALSGLIGVSGLTSRTTPPGPFEEHADLGLSIASLALDRSEVGVLRRDGTVLVGLVQRVGADNLDLRPARSADPLVGPDRRSRPRPTDAAVVVPLGGVLAVVQR